MQNSLLKKIAYLNQTTVESLGETDEKDIIRRFAESSIKIMGAEFGFVWLNRKSSESKDFQLVYTSPEIPYKPKVPRKNGSSYRVIRTRKPLFIEDFTNNKYVRKDAEPYIKSLVIIPMVYKKHVYGSFYFCFKQKRNFSEEDRSLAEFIGNDAGQVMTINTFHKKTEKESQKLLRQKDEFFNIASHELKTPVSAIKGFIQILNQKIKNPESNYFLAKINLHMDKLSRLVNNLLDVSRIETGKIKFKRRIIPLQRLLKETVEDLRITLPRNEISLEINKPLYIRGDREQIERVLINLVTNAAKYSPPKSKIKISLDQKEDKAVVGVEDFGLGINNKDRLKIFNRFFQSKVGTEALSVPGLGLGLYIAKEILKRHNGELSFKNKSVSKGSIFSFAIPFLKR